MYRRMKWAILMASILAVGQVQAGEPLIQLELGGAILQGTPLYTTDQQVMLLGREGAIWQFAPNEATNFKKLSDTFPIFTPAELKKQLLLEFGKGYQVSTAPHYVVVHPAGQRDVWAQRFEELYRSFVHYFKARGAAIAPPRFPLVAVVFSSRPEFDRHARVDGATISSSVVGYYSPTSNRVNMFDQSGGREDANQWSRTASTIIHEATHQTAFNTGLHSRSATSPKWAVEGLATLFEARGVWDSSAGGSKEARINRERLAVFRQALPNRAKGTLAEIISRDDLFQANAGVAYSEAWAVSFYLAETEPKKYCDYLQRLAALPPMSKYRSPERLKDFTAIFGEDLEMLESRILRYIAAIK